MKRRLAMLCALLGLTGAVATAQDFRGEINGNSIALVPPVDAVEEFKIQTNAPGSQSENFSGG